MTAPQVLSFDVPYDPPGTSGLLAIQNCEPVPHQLLDLKRGDEVWHYRITRWEPAADRRAWVCTVELVTQ